MDVALILDIVIAALLVVTITYCAILMGKLNNLRSAQSELRGIIKGFGDAISKAETGIIELRKAGDEAAQALDEKIDHRHRDLVAQIAKATELANDLEFMTDAGNKLADRLETGIREARTSSQRQSAMETPSAEMPPTDSQAFESQASQSSSDPAYAPMVGSAQDDRPTDAQKSPSVSEKVTPPSPLVATSDTPSASTSSQVKMDSPVVDDWDDLDEEPEDPEAMSEMGARSEVERDLLQALRQSK